MTYPFVGEIKMTKVIKDGKEVIEWEQVDMSKHTKGNLGIGSGEMELGGVKWDASAPLVLTPHPAFQQPEPNITFFAGTPTAEVMRINRHGVKVNPEYTVDEVTQHVLDALSAHIQHTVNHAVAQEREACAKVCENGIQSASDWDSSYWDQAMAQCAFSIRARGETK